MVIKMLKFDKFFYNASAWQICLSVRHVPVFTGIDTAVFSVRWDNHSSFWRGKVYPDIRRKSPAARALK